MRILNRGEIAQQCNETSERPLAPHYNVKIKSIIKKDKNKIKIYEGSNYCNIEPQEIVLIITERVSLSLYQIGMLYPKHQDYRKGLWIVEPDIVHPGSSTHLRIHVVNMSKHYAILKAGDNILELFVLENENNFSPATNSENCYDENGFRLRKSEKSYDEIVRVSLNGNHSPPLRGR